MSMKEGNKNQERMKMITAIPIKAALLALLSTQSHGLHNQAATTLRGYHCKDDTQSDAHQPCVLCPEGFYCPDKKTMIECGSVDVYCPLGSVLPTKVSKGYFTIDEAGPEDKRIAQKICEIGYFCAGGGVKKLCPKGHYCNNIGMTEPLVCGDSSVFCRKGSVEPTAVTKGFYSIGGSSNATREEQKIAPRGYFSKEGIVFACPAGHYGNTSGLFTDECSGICEAGWFCPPASTSPRQIACGRESHICPKGSSGPQQVQDGYYTTVFNEEPCRPGKFRAPLPGEEVGVSPVTEKLSKDSCVPCPTGTHKPISGNSIFLCLDCGSRAFTTDGINCECYQSATDKMKSTKSFYDWTSGTCVDITNEDMLKDFPDNFHEPGDQFSKFFEHPCELGHYCKEGIRYKCAAGTFGNKEMEVNSACAGSCKEGYFCPEASTSPTEKNCGSVGVFCPPKSSSPTYVSPGYYSNEDDPIEKKTSQHLCPPGYFCPGDGLKYQCPPGRYGASSGLVESDCDGECSSGYFCKPGSTSPRQSPCGNATVYCPKASKLPLLVDQGYYSASEIYTITANYAGPNATHDIQRECEVGYWCQDGVKYYCPQGTYGAMTQSRNVDQCEPCKEGFYCKSQPAPPTTKETQVECGDAAKYCPQGSAEPRDVDLGYYTLNRFGKEEGLETQRTSQVICP
jgi:hypothetical protein